MSTIRQQLIDVALEWQQRFGVAPDITKALAEYDAAMLVGCSANEYSRFMQPRTAVSRGYDFEYNGYRYQVSGNRPSGKPGSPVTKVTLKTKYDWDYFVWVHYYENYSIREAWLWSVDDYKNFFQNMKRLGPNDMRKGRKIK